MADVQTGRVLRHVRQLAWSHAAKGLTDGQLLQQFAARHDEDAFAAIVQRHGPLVLGVCRNVLHHDHVYRARQIVTDTTGAFRIDEVIPGLKFTLSFRRGKRSFEPVTKLQDITVPVSRSQALDLGDLKLQPLPESDGE